MLRRLWESPTLMTWGAFMVRIGSFFLLLPVVLRTLSAAEIVVWYLFNAVLALQWLLEIGFGSTFSRAISYAMAGAKSVTGFRTVNEDCGDGTPNWDLMSRVVSGMKVIYLLLAAASLMLVGSIGTWAMTKPIVAVDAGTDAWLAWALILIVCPLKMWANVYAYYLEGTNRIALIRRWDILFGLGGIVSGIAVLFLGGGLLGLVAATQAWLLARIFRDRALCHRLDGGRFGFLGKQGFPRDIVEALWPSTWRSGLGGIMTFGVLYGSNLLVAQIAETKSVASYLLAMKLIESVAQFSMAPFYSKVPLLARKRAEGDVAGLVRIARRGMIHSHWTFIAGFLFLAFFADPLLVSIRSNVTFVTPDLWILMGLGFFIQRYGAMHVQLYSTTNHIISHTAEIASGIIFIGVSLALLGKIGIYALPVAMICGYLGFYAWFVARQSYQAIGTDFMTFERLVLLPPMMLFLTYSGLRAGTGLLG